MIRRVVQADREVFCALVDEFYHTDAVLYPIPREYIETTFEEITVSDIYAEGYLFEHEEEVAGYALITKSFSQEAGGRVIWLEEVYIRPKFQGKGIGKEFFGFIEKKHPLKRLRLEVEYSNERAIKLYEDLGYEVLDYKQMVKEFD
ncbi:MAG: GNAT family N-acetyltransferase [Peptostreptococcaceae bacterium]|nr:GNAT family N-acetyltransferase [Peptostreptococcaceae bacterium]